MYRADDGSIKSEAILDEIKLVGNTPISKESYLIKTEKPQFDGITGFAQFFNKYISMINSLKEEYDSNGDLATGSLSQL